MCVKVNCVQMMVSCERAAGQRKVLGCSLDQAVGEGISVVILRVRGQGEEGRALGEPRAACAEGGVGWGAGLRSFRKTGAAVGAQQAGAGLRSVGPRDAIPVSPYWTGSPQWGGPDGESLMSVKGAPDLSCRGCSGGEVGGE